MNWEEIYEKLEKKLEAECRRMGNKIPYIVKNGSYHNMVEEDPFWWTNGFWAGMLWQMYHAGENSVFRECAEQSEEVMARALEGFTGLHHDVGFQFLLTSAANYRMTGNEKARIQALHAAALLAGRFNPAGGFIRAWNKKNGNDMTGWIIIDCLMNLPLLYFAAEELSDPRFSEIANRHADIAMKVLQRPDGSCNHIAILNPMTGEVEKLPAGQGYAEGSSWSRGQAWAIYGYTVVYRETKDPKYLDFAQKVTDVYLERLPEDKVPYWDFSAPGIPDAPRDASAAAVVASALLELSTYLPNGTGKRYKDAAIEMLVSLNSDSYRSGKSKPSFLLHSVGHWPAHSEIDASIIYADYYYIEALLRLKRLQEGHGVLG